MKIKELNIYKENEVIKVSEITCVKNRGIVNDKHYYETSNSISILIYSEFNSDELCRKKYKANMVFTEFSKNLRGSKIKINDAIFEISFDEKKCKFRECRVFQNDCSLKKNALFATCIKGGTVHLYDTININFKI